MAVHDHVVEEEIIPGTRRLFDTNGQPLPGDAHLQKHGDIVLVPQPTDSPNDPLTWPLWRKWLHSLLVLYIVGLTAATSNNAGSGADGVLEEFGISYNVFNTGAGVLFAAIGYWCLLSSPLVHLYGRRISYLIGMLFLLVGSVWYANIDSVGDTVWCQLFVGASESCAEAAVQLSLLDIWFEHQNGTSLGMYTLATAIGTYLGPLVGNYVADALGWRWIGWLGAIFGGASLLVLFFTLEETEFQRGRYVDRTGQVLHIDGQNVGIAEKTLQNQPAVTTDPEASAPEKKAFTSATANTSPALSRFTSPNARNSISYTKKKSYVQRIKPITTAPNLIGLGFKQYITRLYHTLRVFTFPAVWYAGFQWGLQNIALTFYLTVMEDYYYLPPYNYSNAGIGNMNIPCLIGSIVGCIYGGWMSDKFVVWATKNIGKGVMEAERRLWFMALCVIIFPTGMFLFGIGSSRGWDWPVPYVGLGFIGFGYGCAGDLSLTYLADSYPDMVLEGMVGVAVINNTSALIFTFVASAWLEAQGVENTFLVLGGLSILILGSSGPVAYWGKRWRTNTKDRYLKFLELRDGFDR